MSPDAGGADTGAQSLRLIAGDSLSAATAQTGGMVRSAAISGDLVGASELWMGRTVVMVAGRGTRQHHGPPHPQSPPRPGRRKWRLT